ncbi:MAG: phenylacetate-CoA oxygenase subunit PaaJ [Bacteroidetes bacterium]|jgi:ring-1,2-phenylacetyl-CoA epoxidase subunit PaaD|nr:phenylacetate-CoA oxygenase subunit PaaJ [Bacteroidota bacterium]
MITKESILSILAQVSDPEVPVLSILDLGIVRDIQIHDDDKVDIGITPTYSGCPAMSMIAVNIKMELLAHGLKQVNIHEVLSPAWTTDWMTEEGKQKLNAYGIAPPQYNMANNPHERDAVVPCPLCESKDTVLVSQFGSTACKALYKCNSCLEPFDYFKCH